ncbi:Protein bric-a-brac 2 [Araneus ventricosus]|uniref:Protein bric-a-brac 2 n=1 Tax=Araneus ventricosus TaxID=182803 RepID=A0A4Y2GC62_ARAVE|nr:Protein bric-a-brac 2 [Araneus ventricosus]
METELYCLKWSNHQSNILDSFGNLLSDEALCDVTIACEGLSLKAHKLVLSASSTFFHDLFLQNPCTHPIIIIPDLKFIDMKALIDFMYHGQVSVAESQLSTILKAAENLKIKGLGEHSVNSSPTTLKTNPQLPKTSKSNFLQNSENHSEVSQFKNRSGFPIDNAFPEESRLSCNIPAEQNTTCDNSAVCKPSDTASEQNNQLDLSCTVDAQSDIMPSKLMEQSMVTEGVFQEKSFMENQIASSGTDEDNENAAYDSVHINLPENLLHSELHSSNPFNQSFHSLLKDSNVCTDNQLTGEMSESAFNDEGLLSEDKCNIMIQRASSTIPGNLSDTQRSVFPGPKRGRKPGSRLCVLCKHVFNSESDFKSHMDGHRSGSICPDSDSERLPQISDLEDPPLVSEKNLLRLPLQCSTCNYVMTTLSDAQSHLSTNPQCRTSQFKCHLCPKIFIWPATLMKHFREQHEGPGGTTRVTRRLWFFCDVCKKPLLSKHALSLHRSKFHGLSFHPTAQGSMESAVKCKRGRKQGTRVCRFCKRTFTTAIDYHTHLQTFHRNVNSFDTALESSLDMNESVSSIENESNSAQSGNSRM